MFYNVTFTFFSSESGIPACVHTSHNKIAYYPLWSEKNNRDITRENRENFEILALRSFPTSHVGKKIHLTGDSDHQGVAIIKIFFFKKKKNLKFFSTIFFKKNNVYIRFYTCRTVRESWSEKRCDFFKKVSVFSVSVSPPVGERCEKKMDIPSILKRRRFRPFFYKIESGMYEEEKNTLPFFFSGG